MSDAGWQWRPSRKRYRSAEERAYAERVRRNKQKAAKRRWEQERAAEARAIRAKNDAPIF